MIAAARTLAGLAGLLALAACEALPEAAPGPVAAGRDPAVVDIVGSSLLVRTWSEPAGALPTLADLWIEHAGIAAGDPRLLVALTGDGGGILLFCNVAGGPQPARLRAALDRLPEDDPGRIPVTYALAHPGYLSDATFALLTRRMTPEEIGICRQERVELRELVIGELACDEGTCPVVLLLKPERLVQSALARRLIEVVADEPGLLGDTVGLALAGVAPLAALQQERTRAALRELLRRTAPAG